MPTITRHVPGTPAWFDLMTGDVAGAKAFYSALFGWEIEDTGPEYGHYAMCKLGGRNAAGIGEKPADVPWPSTWSVYFAVDDADVAAAAIEAAGGTVTMPPMDIGSEGRMAMVADPGGAVFGLWQPRDHIGAGVMAEPGAMAWCEVNTRDAAVATAFYREVFGLESRALPGDGTTVYHTLQKGDFTACGVLQMNALWEGVPPHWMPYFAVSDADATCRRAAELGGKVSVPPFDTPYGRMAVLNDPQGAVFSIVATAPRA